MLGVLGFIAPLLPAEVPRHLLGIGEVDDLLAGIGIGIDLFDCAVPTRLARHGVALAPEPEGRFRIDLAKARHAEDDSPIAEGCPCEACARHSRAYLHYLARSKELTGARLLTLHNLTYMERLTAHAREAIDAGGYASYSEAILGGAAPWN
jgi:queuine tRNA-ribosyltransferase